MLSTFYIGQDARQGCGNSIPPSPMAICTGVLERKCRNRKRYYKYWSCGRCSFLRVVLRRAWQGDSPPPSTVFPPPHPPHSKNWTFIVLSFVPVLIIIQWASWNCQSPGSYDPMVPIASGLMIGLSASFEIKLCLVAYRHFFEEIFYAWLTVIRVKGWRSDILEKQRFNHWSPLKEINGFNIMTLVMWNVYKIDKTWNTFWVGRYS